MGSSTMMMRALTVIALVAAASALPSPDATVPEMTMTQTMSSAAKAAKATVSKMLETGSSDSACAELADATIAEVADAVSAQQQLLDAFNAPNDGTSCLQEGQDEVAAAGDALHDAQTKSQDADAASASAAGANVDFGPVAISALTEHDGSLCNGAWATDAAYTSAKAAAAAAAAAASEASAA